MLDVNDETFTDEVLQISDEKVVFVKMYAPDCDPCIWQEPIFGEAMEELAAEPFFVQCNVMENPAVTTAIGFENIPAIFAIKNRRVQGELRGLVGKDAIKEFIDENL